jgi:hypothetical protein
MHIKTISDMGTKYIPIEQAVEMRKEYFATDAPLLRAKDSQNNHVATDFAWIKLEDLKDFIATIDTVQSLNSMEVTGVRIYFSAYPNKSHFDSTGNPIAYPMRETVLIVPTLKVPSTPLSLQYENLENLPFFIEPVGSQGPLKGNRFIVKGLLNQFDNQPDIEQNPTAKSTSLIADTLQMVPPPATVV